MGLEESVYSGLRHKIVVGISDMPGRCPWRQIRAIQGHLYNRCSDGVGNPFPVLANGSASIFEAIQYNTDLLLGGKLASCLTAYSLPAFVMFRVVLGTGMFLMTVIYPVYCKFKFEE